MTDRAPRVAVLDYGAANLVSIGRGLAAAGAEVSVATDPAGLAGVDALVVPGVGAAAPAMAHLREQGLVGPLLDWVATDRPVLGICLGYQLLFDTSDEGDAATLGVLSGRVAALRDAPTLPHTGWNSVSVGRPHPLFDDIPAVKPQAEMVEIAAQIIRQQEGKFDPTQFVDHYEEALRKLIREKQKGGGGKVKAKEPEESNVVDLMEALRRSLGGGKGKAAPKKKAAPAHKAPAKRRA